jgi:hypothetical protein
MFIVDLEFRTHRSAAGRNTWSSPWSFSGISIKATMISKKEKEEERQALDQADVSRSRKHLSLARRCFKRPPPLPNPHILVYPLF